MFFSCKIIYLPTVSLAKPPHMIILIQIQMQVTHPQRTKHLNLFHQQTKMVHEIHVIGIFVHYFRLLD